MKNFLSLYLNQRTFILAFFMAFSFGLVSKVSAEETSSLTEQKRDMDNWAMVYDKACQNKGIVVYQDFECRLPSSGEKYKARFIAVCSTEPTKDWHFKRNKYFIFTTRIKMFQGYSYVHGEFGWVPYFKNPKDFSDTNLYWGENEMHRNKKEAKKHDDMYKEMHKRVADFLETQPNLDKEDVEGFREGRLNY